MHVFGPNGSDIAADRPNGGAVAADIFPSHLAVPVEPGSNGHAVAGSALRREILTTLRQDGPASPDQLAGRVGASRTGVLQQLRALEGAQLVSRQTVRHGVGRPRHLYDITPDAQGLFPTNYDGLAIGLLEAIGVVGGDDLVTQVLDARRRQVAHRVRLRLAERLPADAPLADRVRELAVLQDEQGYLCHAEIDDDGATIRLREHNCAIYHVAMGLPAACGAELRLFAEVLDADVVRETHIASGDRCCSYRITARAGD
jgi:predicted ArsR family transcriptional regulator